MPSLPTHARHIFAQALAAVDIRRAVMQNLRCNADTLSLGPRAVPLAKLDRILVVAIGKAAVAMYQASREVLGASNVPCTSIVIAPDPPLTFLPNVVFLPGSHPTPDAGSLVAAEAVLALLRTATPKTIVLFLLSGGASAMLEQPLFPALSLEDLAGFHRALVASGLSITQMNTLRKHVSAVKGGRLALAAATALAQHTLLISDVPSSTPDTIGSGPTLPDPSTLSDCDVILDHVILPAAVTAFLTSTLCPETPKPFHPAFARVSWATILSSDDLALAAAHAAHALGFHIVIDNSCDDWEYREAAHYLLARSAAIARTHPRTCLISVGELSVALPAYPGEGGRNQHFALWCAAELARTGQSAAVLSAGSDGIDGATAAAGAVCDQTTLPRAAALDLSVEAALALFSSAPLLSTLEDQIITGPTGNNLRDLRLILRE